MYAETPGDKRLAKVNNVMLLGGSDLVIYRDLLLKISNLLPDYSFLRALSDQKDLRLLLSPCLPSFITAMNQCTQNTHATHETLKKFTQNDNPFAIETSNSMRLSRVKPKRVEATQHSSEQLLDVPTIKMDWFFKNAQGLLQFAKLLLDLPDEVYTSEFV